MTENSVICEKEIPIPEITDGEALIKVHYCGICGSDIGITYSHSYVYPLVLGHEFSGEVIKVGSEKNNSLIGKAVTAYPVLGCMKCRQCLEKDYTKCLDYSFIGSRRDGAFAEYIKVPIENIMEIGDLDYKRGALIEPVAVSVHAVRRLANEENMRAIIIGAGTIGLLVAQVCKALGYSHIVILDVDSNKVNYAKELGFEESYNSLEVDVKSVYKKLGLQGPDVIFECSGAGPALINALDLIAPNGTVVMVGIFKRELTLSPKDLKNIMKKEINLTGAWVSNYYKTSENDWTIAKELIESDKINCDSMITDIIKLSEVKETLKNLHDNPGKSLKILISLE